MDEDKATKGGVIWKTQGVYGADDTAGTELKLGVAEVRGAGRIDGPI